MVAEEIKILNEQDEEEKTAEAPEESDDKSEISNPGDSDGLDGDDGVIEEEPLPLDSGDDIEE